MSLIDLRTRATLPTETDPLPAWDAIKDKPAILEFCFRQNAEIVAAQQAEIARLRDELGHLAVLLEAKAAALVAIAECNPELQRAFDNPDEVLVRLVPGERAGYGDDTALLEDVCHHQIYRSLTAWFAHVLMGGKVEFE